MSRAARILAPVFLAAIVPWFALLGAMLDEVHHLGFTNWQSACRGSGVTFGSLLLFTWELLPGAITGALGGGLVLQLLAWNLRREPRHAANCVSAHLSCVLTMPVGLFLCALAWPVPAMLLVEVALAAAGAMLIGLAWNRGAPSASTVYP